MICNCFQKIADKDVQCAAAEDGGGAAEEGGQHQAHLRVPGRGGHQGEPTATMTLPSTLTGSLSTFLENMKTNKLVKVTLHSTQKIQKPICLCIPCLKLKLPL